MSYLEDWDEYLEPEETTTLGGDTMPDQTPNSLFVTDTNTISYVMPKPEPTTLSLVNKEGTEISILPNGDIKLRGELSEDADAIVSAIRQWAIDHNEAQMRRLNSMGSVNLREGMSE